VPPRLLRVLLLGALALALGACGGGEEVSPVPEAVETVATTTETAGGETETGGGETETGGGETETVGETNPGVTNPGVTNPGETDAAETETEAGGGGGSAAGNAAAGEAVWTEGGCGGCHTLDAAGSEGQIGPNLDQAEPAFDLVVERVTNGMGAMPAFKEDLSEEQIQNVAAYVVESTGGG